jgi:hypothetical protein
VAAHEAEHVRAMRRLLGRAARPAPALDFGDATHGHAFLPTAVRLEELALATYNGLAPGLSRHALAVVVEVTSVEARHAAWARNLAGRLPAPRAADVSVGGRASAAALRATQFVR